MDFEKFLCELESCNISSKLIEANPKRKVYQMKYENKKIPDDLKEEGLFKKIEKTLNTKLITFGDLKQFLKELNIELSGTRTNDYISGVSNANYVKKYDKEPYITYLEYYYFKTKESYEKIDNPNKKKIKIIEN